MKKLYPIDIKAGIVVFFVALPLCLGISLASGAPLISGMITGIVGGILIPLISNSTFSVSGPAAGLTVIVASSIAILGNFNNFLLAVAICGVLQLLLGFLKGGSIGDYFPSAVINGMLVAIGLILILKQIPHAVGYDKNFEGDFDFIQSDNQNTFTEIITAFEKINLAACIIFIICFGIILLFEKYLANKIKLIPSSLIVVFVGTLLNLIFENINFQYGLRDEHLVNIPQVSFATFANSGIWNSEIGILKSLTFWKIVFTITCIASIETLLSIEAVDKIDPSDRISDKSLELKAQGIGNLCASLLGGLPMTSVIVRSSTNVNAGAKSKWAIVIHGVLLLISLLVLRKIINFIPLSALAAILIYTGLKLSNIKIFKEIYSRGKGQFFLFVITIIAILFTDLLKGVALGVVLSYAHIIYINSKFPFIITNTVDGDKENIEIELSENVSYLSKGVLLKTLQNISKKKIVKINAKKSKYIHPDVLEVIDRYTSKNQESDLKVIRKNFETDYEALRVLNNKNLEDNYKRLFINNRNWVKHKTDENPDFFTDLAKGQSPKYLFIGCSDSRVPANEITGTDAGEMFVHRNIANMVIHTDLNLMSVLQYAVEILKVEHIIVCGHYGCGGVKAASSHSMNGIVDKWLRNIKDVKRIYFDKLKILPENGEERHRLLVELNVREQVYHLCETTIVQKAWKDKSNVKVHGWVYDIADGLIKDLEIDVNKDFTDFHIYKYDEN